MDSVFRLGSNLWNSAGSMIDHYLDQQVEKIKAFVTKEPLIQHHQNEQTWKPYLNELLRQLDALKNTPVISFKEQKKYIKLLAHFMGQIHNEIIWMDASTVLKSMYENISKFKDASFQFLFLSTLILPQLISQGSKEVPKVLEKLKVLLPQMSQNTLLLYLPILKNILPEQHVKWYEDAIIYLKGKGGKSFEKNLVLSEKAFLNPSRKELKLEYRTNQETLLFTFLLSISLFSQVTAAVTPLTNINASRNTTTCNKETFWLATQNPTPDDLKDGRFRVNHQLVKMQCCQYWCDIPSTWFDNITTIDNFYWDQVSLTKDFPTPIFFNNNYFQSSVFYIGGDLIFENCLYNSGQFYLSNNTFMNVSNSILISPTGTPLKFTPNGPAAISYSFKSCSMNSIIIGDPSYFETKTNYLEIKNSQLFNGQIKGMLGEVVVEGSFLNSNSILGDWNSGKVNNTTMIETTLSGNLQLNITNSPHIDFTFHGAGFSNSSFENISSLTLNNPYDGNRFDNFVFCSFKNIDQFKVNFQKMTQFYYLKMENVFWTGVWEKGAIGNYFGNECNQKAAALTGKNITIQNFDFYNILGGCLPPTASSKQMIQWLKKSDVKLGNNVNFYNYTPSGMPGWEVVVITFGSLLGASLGIIGVIKCIQKCMEKTENKPINYGDL